MNSSKIIFHFFIFGVSAILILTLPVLRVSAHGVAIIRMTEEGFEPKEITVDENTIVRFINEDTRDRWPASNPHPIHTAYSVFDPRKPIPPGESWHFRPKKIGTWRYHDHLSPHIRATLTVVPEEGAVLQSETKTIFEKINLTRTPRRHRPAR